MADKGIKRKMPSIKNRLSSYLVQIQWFSIKKEVQFNLVVWLPGVRFKMLLKKKGSRLKVRDYKGKR